MTEETKAAGPTRLPPPVFPPGSRQRIRTGAGAGEDGAPTGSADRPVLEDGQGWAFISPDDPLPERVDGLAADAGTVTGLGDAARYTPRAISSSGDPHVRELTLAVAKLAEGLRRRGEAGLQATPDMSRFEATLRAYCVGYLAGRRADGEAHRDQEDTERS